MAEKEAWADISRRACLPASASLTLYLEAQNAFVVHHEGLCNGRGAAETIVYGDTVQPIYRMRVAKVEVKRGEAAAVLRLQP